LCSLIRFSAWPRAHTGCRRSTRRADIEAGDDEADVEAERGRLNTGDCAPFAIQDFAWWRSRYSAQNRQVLDGASRADVVGDLVDFSGERLVQTDRRCSRCRCSRTTSSPRPSIVPVATERNSRLVPPRADVPYQAAKMGTDSTPPGVLPAAVRPPRAALLRVIDVDRQEAAFVIMSVEQRELLMAWTTSQVSSMSSVTDSGSRG